MSSFFCEELYNTVGKQFRRRAIIQFKFQSNIHIFTCKKMHIVSSLAYESAIASCCSSKVGGEPSKVGVTSLGTPPQNHRRSIGVTCTACEFYSSRSSATDESFLTSPESACLCPCVCLCVRPGVVSPRPGPYHAHVSDPPMTHRPPPPRRRCAAPAAAAAARPTTRPQHTDTHRVSPQSWPNRGRRGRTGVNQRLRSSSIPSPKPTAPSPIAAPAVATARRRPILPLLRPTVLCPGAAVVASCYCTCVLRNCATDGASDEVRNSISPP